MSPVYYKMTTVPPPDKPQTDFSMGRAQKVLLDTCICQKS